MATVEYVISFCYKNMLIIFYRHLNCELKPFYSGKKDKKIEQIREDVSKSE